MTVKDTERLEDTKARARVLREAMEQLGKNLKALGKWEEVLSKVDKRTIGYKFQFENLSLRLIPRIKFKGVPVPGLSKSQIQCELLFALGTGDSEGGFNVGDMNLDINEINELYTNRTKNLPTISNIKIQSQVGLVDYFKNMLKGLIGALFSLKTASKGNIINVKTEDDAYICLKLLIESGLWNNPQNANTLCHKQLASLSEFNLSQMGNMRNIYLPLKGKSAPDVIGNFWKSHSTSQLNSIVYIRKAGVGNCKGLLAARLAFKGDSLVDANAMSFTTYLEGSAAVAKLP